MTKKCIFSELFIINKFGVCMFCLQSEKDTDPDLISGIFTAIQIVMGKHNNDGTNCIRLSNSVLYAITSDLFYVAGRTSTKFSEKDAYNSLQHIKILFEKHFGRNDIEDWDGRIDKFSSFKKIVESYFGNCNYEHSQTNTWQSITKKFRELFVYEH